MTELRRTEDGKLVCELERADWRQLLADRLAGARAVRGQGPRRHDGHLRRDLPADELRSAEEVPGHRGHLRRAAGLVRAQGLPAVLQARRRWPSWASSWCRSTAWARRTARRSSTTCAGRTWATPAFPDRIPWIKAAAAKYPCMDLTRVGIYGGSAGGQNAAGRAADARRLLQGGRGRLRLPRQPHGQDLVERAVDGLAGRPALRRAVERHAGATSCRASCC